MLDAFQAINGHVAWKSRLTRYIRGEALEIDPKAVCSDKECTLGRWINDRFGTYHTVPEFQTMQILHSNFHACACEIIWLVDNGDTTRAQELLKGEYEQVSQEIKKTIIDFDKRFRFD